MNKLILTVPAVLALAACGTTAQPARTVALTAAVHPLSCHAYVSDSRPADGTATVVHVRTQASVKVFTVAFYKTVDRAYFVRAALGGDAQIRYHVSGATPGRKVPVAITVVRGHSARTCSTSFTPRRPASAPTPPSPTPTPTPTLSPMPTPTPTPSPVPSTSAACHPLDSKGNCYKAGEYCPNADHGMHGIAQNGEPIVCEDDNGWRWEAD